jgi:hypothetical protein
MSYKDNIDTVWEIEHADPKVRFEAKGNLNNKIKKVRK